ncbi:MAG: hypothetical protein DMF50_07080 [Acidobacteria bacterium]|nr:MAG: hypothetical protein DMF50_07080 [Acidobacteriota bacterium]
MTSIRPTPGPLARNLVLAALGLTVALAFPSPAHALGDIVGGEAAPWFQGFSGSARIDDGSTTGTNFDFKSDLGLANRDTSPMGRVWFRLGKSRLTIDYADSSRTGRDTISKDITFNGTTYTATDTVDSRLDLKLYKTAWRYSFLDLKLVEFSAGIGFNAAKIDAALDSTSTGATRLNQTVPFPTVNASVIVKPFPGFHIRTELDGLSVDVSGNKVTIYDARVQLEWYILHAFGLQAGYRQFRFDVDADKFGHVESTFKGPYVGLGVKF